MVVTSQEYYLEAIKNHIKTAKMYDHTTNLKLTPDNELTATTGNQNHRRFSMALMLDRISG
ncbi:MULTISPECIES: hypothetical protein [Arsenophonus]|jgi:hypothetical protein|uniref:hypothetical protein n=1 Tax=Arsenophonus TaxID=637 RepID=UPI0015D6AF10|nr:MULTISPECIES: hypothetical protein [Arsenophonus]UBX28757.1 hypothetical protein LDL57_13375 [Arsenophonus apicola]